ncbi:UNVERIFIED_CONTAM: hypothetical protein FKN15_046387 [Acipenser sinensis]
MYSELFGTDRDLLLDLGPVDQPDCYGSIENGSFMGTRYLDEDDDEDPIYIHCERGGTRASDPHGNFFRDGRTKIDFVLVWEVRNHSRKKRRARSRYQELGKEEQKSADSKETKHSRWRDKFVRNLQNTGLLLEKEETVSDRKTIHYLKLSAPWDVLVYYAEELCLRAPLQAQPNPDLNSSDQFLKNLWIPNIMSQSVPKKPVDYYTCAFRKSKMAKFVGCEDHDTYFTNTQRHRIVYEILARTAYGKRKRAEIGIDRLLNEGAYSAAFPLHEGPFEISTFEVDPEQLNSRQVIFQYWGRWSKWYKYQPLDHIREYFGEKIAIYFAWLGFYTAWLLPAAVMGTFVFISGIISMGTNTPAEEICSSGGSYHMCPLCETCSTWNISDICSMAKLGYLFDHPGTVFFSVFMSLWAVTFLEYWKRKNATLAHHWDCMDFQEEEERPRPEFAAMAPTMEQNPVTGVKEPYFPEKARLSRMLTGSMVIVVMLCVVMIFLVTVIMYRGIVSMMMYHTESIVLRTQQCERQSRGLALWLLLPVSALVQERPRPEFAAMAPTMEQNPVTGVKEPYFPEKARLSRMLTGSMVIVVMCGPGGCLIELAEQLFIIMVGKQIINNIQEFVVPKVKAWLQKRQIRAVRGSRISQEPKRWEEDYELIECEGLFEEYLEMVLQFGFITIFVAAFPLAPLFALLNNWVEIRLDAQKFVCEYRRPVAERAQDIGVWFNILEALSHLSVIVNAFLIAFTSDFLPRLLYQYKFDSNLHGYVNFTLAHAPPSYMDGNHTQCRYKSFRDDSGNYTLFYWELLAVRLGFIIAFEHVVFLILRAIDWIVPDVPESLALKIKRERYLAKQALADNQDAVLRVSQGSASTPVLQFGFITIFVAAFPLAPLFALLNNWVEIRLDAQKFVCEYRRPVAERAQDIGVWFNILEALSHLSVIVNAFLIAFTSDFLPRLLYQYKFDSNLHGYVNFTLAHAPPSYMDGNHTQCRYKSFRDDSGNYTLFYWELLAVRLGFIIAFEHVVFLILRAIDWIVPDVPESLALKIKRERYLAKQALADNQDAVLRVKKIPNIIHASYSITSKGRKMRVYSPESRSDESLSSPSLECEYLFSGSIFEEELNTKEAPPLDAVLLAGGIETKPPAEKQDTILPGHTLQDKSSSDVADTTDFSEGILAAETANQSSRNSEQERRRFSASELISRLQLSQRKSSFSLKLGKSLSARVTPKDKGAPRSLSPEGCEECRYALIFSLVFDGSAPGKQNARDQSSASSIDSAPHSPLGPGPPLPGDCTVHVHKGTSRHRKNSIEENAYTPAFPSYINRLSRFMPNSILYQEYSDVAINREIQRQQWADAINEEDEDGVAQPSCNVSPTNSFRSQRSSRGSAFSLWQDIPDVRASGMLATFSNEERKLQETPGSYNSVQVEQRFLQDLEVRLEEDILRFDVCDIVLAHCPAFRRVYLPYVTNQAYQEQTYQRLLQENPRFPGILARLEEDQVCQRLPLTSFLILPFQRITRLKMLVENILKRTAPGSQDEDTATKAFNELKKLIKECNSSVQSMKRTEELIHLNKKIHFEGKIFPLISQSRWLVKHGELVEVDTQTISMSGSKFKLRPVYLHLFNDCLLLSRKKETGKFAVFVHAKIGELKVKDLNMKLHGISGFIFHLQLCEERRLKHQILLKANTESEKQRWIAAMFPSDPVVSKGQISENEDLAQVQCIKSYKAQEHDELTLEKADILQAKTKTSDGWIEGIRLSDGERGWFPRNYVEEITSRSARLRNLRENNRIKCATQKLEEEQENPRFPGILARLEEDQVCQRLPLTSFLILPFQRITRLKMLVENILKRTAPGSQDEDTATKAFNELKKLIKECNSSVQSMKRTEELIHLNKKIHFEGKIFPLISQSRWLVKHGELVEVDTQTISMSGSKFKLRPVYLHLFNDCLLLSRKKETGKFAVFVHAKIGELKVKDLNMKLHGISGFIFHLQLCEERRLKHQILLKANTESEKQRWIAAMFPSDPVMSKGQISENEDLAQVQCIKSYKAQEHDELTLEKADILQAKTKTSDGWIEGIRLSDGERGWFPRNYVEEITSSSARLRNLRENNRIKCATQKLEEEFLQDLEVRLEEDILRFDVCDIVLAHCPAFRRVYLPYVTNQAYQEQTYQRLLQENPRFPGILARLEEDQVCQRLPLTSFLILPFQRITRLKMLVEVRRGEPLPQTCTSRAKPQPLQHILPFQTSGVDDSSIARFKI